MTDTMVHLTSRVPRELIDKIDALAKRRRMQTGENTSRADLVREALEALDSGEPRRVDAELSCPDDVEAMRLTLNALADLARDAEERGLLKGAPQDLGMAVWKAGEGREDLDLLLDYVSKMHGALRAV